MSNYRIDDVERSARLFQALGNPGRLQVFLRLAECCTEPCGGVCGDRDSRRCVGELGAGLGLAPSTVSHHLKELRAAGLIQCERRGRFIDCWVEPETLARLRSWFDPSEGRGTTAARGERT